MKKTILLYIALISVMAILWYIYYPTATPSSPWGNLNTGLRGEIEEKYFMITYDSGDDYWKNAFKGFEDAAETLNVSVDYVGATNYDSNEQVTILEQVIAKKPKGIAIAGIDSPELLDALNKAVDADIPIVAIDTKLDSANVKSFIGTDNYSAGAEAARRLVKETGPYGDIAIMMNNEQSNHQLRMKGFIDTMVVEFPNRKIVNIANGQGSRVEARKQAIAILDRNPNVTGIFATDTEDGIGVAEAAVYYKKKSIKIVSFDADIRTLDMIKQGIITASIEQGTWNMGYWSLQYLFHLKHNLLNETAYNDRNIPLLPKQVYTDISFITKDNVNNFYVK
jgi:ribose transport system substrate-binding protein